MALGFNLGNDGWDYGDVSAISGLTGISLAFTIDTSAATPTGRFVGQWGGLSGVASFLITVAQTNEIGFVVTETGNSSDFYGEYTTALNLAANTRYRVLVRWTQPQSMEIWVNGSNIATTVWFNNSPTFLKNATSDLFVGYESDESTQGVEGDMAEVAIWDHYVPDWVAEGYTNGWSPAFYPRGGIIYTRALATGSLVDAWGGNTITQNGTPTDADHPQIVMPSSQIIVPSPAAAATEGAGTATGTATVTAVGESDFAAAGAIVGTGTVIATGASIFAGTGAIVGTAIITSVGESDFAAAGSVIGAVTVTASGESTFAAVGTTIGAATVSGVGESAVTGVEEGVGAIIGAAIAEAIGASIFSGVGAISGEAIAAGFMVDISWVEENETQGNAYAAVSTPAAPSWAEVPEPGSPTWTDVPQK